MTGGHCEEFCSLGKKTHYINNNFRFLEVFHRVRVGNRYSKYRCGKKQVLVQQIFNIINREVNIHMELTEQQSAAANSFSGSHEYVSSKFALTTLEVVSDRAITEKKEKPKRVRGRKVAGLPDRRIAPSLVGQVFGKLTVLGEVGRNKWGHLQLACECECGNQTVTTRGKLTAKDPKQRATSCGCTKAEKFVKFNDKIAGDLPTEISSDIFRLRCYGESAEAIARDKGLSKAVVDGAVRITGRSVMRSPWMPVIISGVRRGHNYATIAARTGLLQSTIAYIAKRIRQQEKDLTNESRNAA